MIVLGLDTATPATAVAVLDTAADTVLGEALHDAEPGARPGHAEQLLALAAEQLAAAGLRFADVDRIAIGLGPGTFTGLRIGVATARALAQGAGAELVGVSTLEALGAAAGALDPSVPGVLAVVDARRGEVFAAGWRNGRPALGPLAVAPAALAERAGPGWLACGDGAVRFRDVLEGPGLLVAPDESPRHRVSAATVCRLGAAAEPAPSPDDVVPDYLRQPDAAKTPPPTS